MKHNKIHTLALKPAGLVLAAGLLLSGCATTANNPVDPYEGFNRAVFTFNDNADKYVLKPIATGYKTVTPSFVQTGIGNFFANLGDLWTAANNFMQGKGNDGMSDVSRVAVNSTFGILGLIDVASMSGLPKHNEDFGQTLGTWGVGPGPYLMLPLLGPSTVRDTAGLPLDFFGDPLHYKEPIYIRNIADGLRIVDKRAALLDASNLLEDAALDRYEFIRDGYLQQRQNKIDDGESHHEKRKTDAPSDVDPAGAGVKPPSAEISAPVSSEPVAQELNQDTQAVANASL
jgi:phospholipid-binding lipoprotein MlaA